MALGALIIQTKFQYADENLWNRLRKICICSTLSYFPAIRKTPLFAENSDDDNSSRESANKGTLTLDATGAQANIRYPQDISLLNEVREKLKTIIYRFCKSYGLSLPKRYSKHSRNDYLTFAKSKKHSTKKICKALRKQLVYVTRDIRYLDQSISDGYAIRGREISLYLTIIKLHEQQQFMYDNRVHTVEHRIVSISQPWVRPIIRGKVKAPI